MLCHINPEATFIRKIWPMTKVYGQLWPHCIQHLCTGINYSNQIINSWNNSCKAENIRIGKQICELVFMRDSLDPWLLDNLECIDIIEYLAVT